jgi:hypothetical protein
VAGAETFTVVARPPDDFPPNMTYQPAPGFADTIVSVRATADTAPGGGTFSWIVATTDPTGVEAYVYFAKQTYAGAVTLNLYGSLGIEQEYASPGNLLQIPLPAQELVVGWTWVLTVFRVNAGPNFSALRGPIMLTVDRRPA